MHRHIKAMYKFLIVAYDHKIDDNQMLTDATEIWIDATNSADALAEAKRIFIAKNYFIKRIEKIYININVPNVQKGQQIG